jgi:hypothetical protein
MRFKKRKKEPLIRKRPDGNISLDFGGSEVIIQIRAETPEEQLEAVRMIILAKGLVFTEKIEKNVRKII